LEIIVTDEITAHVVYAIQRTAHTGRDGDGKILVMLIDDAIRIRTGERGANAL